MEAKLEDRDVAGNVMTMLLAGEDTTANTLAWMLYLLQQNPEARRRVEETVGAAMAMKRCLAGTSSSRRLTTSKPAPTKA